MNEEQLEQTLNWLAKGIEMRLYLHMGLSDIAIEETKYLARKLDISEESIHKWAIDRKTQSANVKQDIESLLTLLKNNAIARNIFSNFVLYEKPGYNNDKLN